MIGNQVPIISEPTEGQGQNNLKSIKLAYKHKRMQSKNALVNHYKSLSLMNTDDFSKFMTPMTPVQDKY